jgi:hypothetical protein
LTTKKNFHILALIWLHQSHISKKFASRRCRLRHDDRALAYTTKGGGIVVKLDPGEVSGKAAGFPRRSRGRERHSRSPQTVMTDRGGKNAAAGLRLGQTVSRQILIPPTETGSHVDRDRFAFVTVTFWPEWGCDDILFLWGRLPR